jgi:hypothetical protein
MNLIPLSGSFFRCQNVVLEDIPVYVTDRPECPKESERAAIRTTARSLGWQRHRSNRRKNEYLEANLKAQIY